MRKTAILIADPSVDILQLLAAALSTHYAVDATESFAYARAECRHQKHAALVIDVGSMQARDEGVDLIREVRGAGDERSIIAVASLHDPDLESRAYEAGADVVLNKGAALVRQLRASLRRLTGRAGVNRSRHGRVDGILLPERSFAFAGATIDPIGMTAAFPRGGVQHLNPKEIGILHVFATRGADLVRRSEILSHVWGPMAVSTSKTLDTYLVRLRRTYEAGGLDLSRTLRAKPKVGWIVFEAPNS